MIKRTATCQCGQLEATCTGEPVRISACHCLDCQKRSGSAFAAQAWYPEKKVSVKGNTKHWERMTDAGHLAHYHFCPECGSTLYFNIEGWDGVIAVPLGGFGDPDFPAPKFSVYEHRQPGWVEITGDVEHSSTPSSARNPGKDLAD